jgi:hypothetical protein
MIGGMGREAKRVPMDFDWPLKKVWDGYLLPDELCGPECPNCSHGWTDAAEWVKGIAALVAMAADDADDEARGRHMHPYLTPIREVSYCSARTRPGREFAEFADGISSDARPGILGRDVYRMYSALVAAAGLPKDWGTCRTCQGHGYVERYPGQRDDAEAWEPTEPPAGEGWQMWETTSEGRPSSPVFAMPEELAAWCAENETVFGNHRADRAQWLKIITGEDFAHVTIAPGVVVM